MVDWNTKEVVPRTDLLNEFANWAAREPESPCRERGTRRLLLARMLGESYEENAHLARSGVEGPAVRLVNNTGIKTMSKELRVLFEHQISLRHAPARTISTANDGAARTDFLIPWWLNGDPEAVEGLFDDEAPIPRTLRVRFCDDGLRFEDALTEAVVAGDALRAIGLRRKAPSWARRQNILSTATVMVDELAVILGTPPTRSDWLWRMVQDTETFEHEALRLWNDSFLSQCEVPPSFSLGDRVLSLADLQVLWRGAEGGRHRRVFAEQHPWVTRKILDGPHPDRCFEPIDNNPSASIKVAAKMFCCASEGDCPKAIRFARLVPRSRHNPALDHLFGLEGSGADSHQVRSILLEAHEQDGELLSHVGEDTRLTRRQIRRTIDVVFTYRDNLKGSFACAYAFATLLVRMFVRNEFDPDAVDVEELTAGLAAFSADSLAAVAAEALERRPASLPDPDADMLDAGVLAFLSYVGETRRPRLTMRQLVRFAAAARSRSVHPINVASPELEEAWPAPPGWPAGERTTMGSAIVTFLASFGAMTVEGDEMEICLRDGRFQRAAVLGRLALFSIKAADGRATLSLAPEESELDDTLWVEDWSIDQLRSERNGKPSPGCKEAAAALLAHLNGECPRPVPHAERRRRTRIQRALDRSRSFNPDAAVAMERWTQIYVKNLPRSFRDLTPAMIVERYLRKSPKSDPE